MKIEILYGSTVEELQEAANEFLKKNVAKRISFHIEKNANRLGDTYYYLVFTYEE